MNDDTSTHDGLLKQPDGRVQPNQTHQHLKSTVLMVWGAEKTSICDTAAKDVSNTHGWNMMYAEELLQ